MACDDPEPLPGDFDEELEELDPADLQVVEPSRERHVTLAFMPDGMNDKVLQRIAEEQDKILGRDDVSEPDSDS